MNREITLAELEAAINFWRHQAPSVGEEARLCPQASALATPYALLIFHQQRSLREDDLDTAAREALAQWRAATGST